MTLLSACSGAVSSFYVEDAGSGDPLRLQRLAERTATTASEGMEYAEIVRAHRIGPGTGTVLSYREASGGYEERVTRLTIFLPDGVAVPGTTIQFSGSAAPSGPVALLSDLSPPVETYDCTGFAAGGELTFRRVEIDRIVADLTMDFDMVPLNEYDACAPLRLKRSIEFDRKSLEDLQPWEGRATGPYMSTEWNPLTARNREWKASTFAVENAEEGEPRWHEALRGRIADGAVPVIDWKYTSVPHRIGDGRGTVFAYRSFGNQKYAMDAAFGFGLTLFLRQPLPASPTTIPLGSGSGGNVAFASDWSNWGGCVAYASDGEIAIEKITPEFIFGHVRLQFDWVAIDWNAGMSGMDDCKNDEIFVEDFVFERKAYSDLTPFEGRSDKPVGEPIKWKSEN